MAILYEFLFVFLREIVKYTIIKHLRFFLL